MSQQPDNGTILERLAALQEMNIAQLREEFERHFGKPSLSRNKRQLVKRIAERIQSEAAGEKPGDTIPGPVLTVKYEPKKKGRSKRVAKPEKATAEKKARVKPIGSRDPRLPKPGTVIEREWHGKKYHVRVMQPGLGFEYDGKPFRSLSVVAGHITGQVVNGFVWWGLGLPAEETKKS
jgi:hypothetical protein